MYIFIVYRILVGKKSKNSLNFMVVQVTRVYLITLNIYTAMYRHYSLYTGLFSSLSMAEKNIYLVPVVLGI